VVAATLAAMLSSVGSVILIRNLTWPVELSPHWAAQAAKGDNTPSILDLPHKARNVLARCGRAPLNTVAIISGRRFCDYVRGIFSCILRALAGVQIQVSRAYWTALVSLAPSAMAQVAQLCLAYDSLNNTPSDHPCFFACVMQLIQLVPDWQPASDDVQSMQFAGQVMDLLDAKVREHARGICTSSHTVPFRV
jgi:hypothetical protein